LAHFRRGASSNRHQTRRLATVLDLARGLRGRALDYGAGWGDITARLAPQFDEIVGVDADARRVEFARTEYAPLQFSLCGVERTEFEDQSFDAVLSIVVLPFVPSAEQYLAECQRLVRPDGALVIMLPNPESLRMQTRRWRGRPVQGRPWGGRTLAEIRAFLLEHGFRVERENGFYVLSLVSAVAHGLKVPGRWSYVGFRCRRER
jgi:2-polyprenyl-3-methyl-5-hydroxy-6-metoxy-1,4-benzoquinol methylase